MLQKLCESDFVIWWASPFILNAPKINGEANQMTKSSFT